MMAAPIRIRVLQGSPEWHAARRELITATDIPVLLGLSPYRSEADLAEEKLGLREPVESNTRMRVGSALEDLIADLYAESRGVKVRRVRGLWRSAEIEWAGASPDAQARKTLLEIKWTGSRSRFADGLPQDVEAQARWQALVGDVPAVEVVTLTVGDDDIRTFTVERDEATERGLIEIAADFRRRLAAGGPFEESNESVRRRYPRDNGAEMTADAELAGWVRELVTLRSQRKDLAEAEERLEASIKSRMGEVALLRGDGFRVSWKRSKDGEATDWKALAEHLLAPMPETDRAAVVGPFVTVREGARYFRVTTEKEDAS
jgi:putative phage-type endonuclease